MKIADSNRICALILTRLIIAISYRAPDFHSEGLIGLFTALEPILGVIVACLPFLHSVFARIKQTHMWIDTSTSLRSIKLQMKKGGNSVVTRTVESNSSPTNLAHCSHFRRLEDVEMHAVVNPSSEKGFGDASSSDGRIRDNETWMDLDCQDRILVRNEIRIESEQRRYT